jgi:hypothetical protein
MGDYVFKRKYELDLRSMEDFVRIERVKESLAKIDKDQTVDEEKRAIEAFEKAVHQKDKVESEDAWDDD